MSYRRSRRDDRRPGRNGRGYRRPALSSGPERSTTLYVGSIPDGVSDIWISKLLRACGPYRYWKRTVDQDGKPKGFGFCEYEEAEGALRALRVLGGGDDQNTETALEDGLELPALAAGAVAKRLVVKADDKTRQFLDDTVRQRQSDEGHTDETAQNDDEAVKAVRNIVAQLHAEANPKAKPVDLSKLQEADVLEGLAYLRDLVDDVPAATPVGSPKSASGPPTGPRSRTRSPSRTHHPRSRSRSPVQVHSERSHERPQRPTRSWKDKHEIDLHAKFKEREHRYLRRERQRFDRLESDLAALARLEEGWQPRRDSEARRLAEWDDEVERKAAKDPYYHSRTRWLRNRRLKRKQELEEEERDRLLELKEQKEEEEREKAKQHLKPTKETPDQEATENPIVEEGKPSVVVMAPKVELSAADQALLASLPEEQRTPANIALLRELPDAYEALIALMPDWDRLSA
ncbi:hypothetical protein IWQ60_011776, partial [Tieghemiomyces parasiticus]